MKGSYDRFRRTDARREAEFTVHDWNFDGTDQGVRGGSFPGAIGEDRYISDIYDSSYFARVKKGEVIVRPFTARKLSSTCSSTTGTTGFIDGWGTREWNGDVAFFLRQTFESDIGQLLADYLPGMMDLAMTDALSKVESPDLLLGVSIAEARKTQNMFNSPLASARDVLGRMTLRKRRLLSQGLSLGKAASKAWLEYQLGWRPAAMDLAGAAKAVMRANPASPRPKRKVVRGGLTRTFSKSTLRNPPGSLVYVSTLTCHDSLKLELKVGAGVIYDVYTNPALGVLSSAGLTWDNAASTAWELVPLSWLADYYANTGKWLSAMVPRAGVVYRGTWITSKQVVATATSATGIIDVVIGGVHHVTPLPFGSFRETWEKASRSYGSTRPNWSLTPPMGGYQMANSVALGFSKIADSLRDFSRRR